MGFKRILPAVLALASIAALASSAGAADVDGRIGYGNGSRRATVYNRRYRVYSREGVGGQRVGNQYLPYVPYFSGRYYQGPYFSNQTFWERVETQSDYPVR